MANKALEALKKKREAEKNNNASTVKRIPFEDFLYLRGENCLVKLLPDVEGEWWITRYFSEFYKDVNGEDIKITYQDGNTANKVSYTSPKTANNKDALIEYRNNNYTLYSQDQAKAMNTNIKCKEQIFFVGKILQHKDPALVGTVKIFRQPSQFYKWLGNCIVPAPIKDTVTENASVAIETYHPDMGAISLPDKYTVVDVGSSSLEVDKTIEDGHKKCELKIDGVIYTFTGVSGNTFTGVTQKSYEDAFEYDSEYVLHLSPEVMDNGGSNVFQNYAGKSSFKKISDLNIYPSSMNGKKFSDFEDVEEVKKLSKHKLSEAIGKVNTYEESYLKFHKNYLKEDIKDLADVTRILASSDTEEPQTPQTASEPTPTQTEAPKAKPQQLKIDDSDKKTAFEEKMETVDVKEPTTVSTTVSTEEKPKAFSMDSLNLDSINVDTLKDIGV